MYWVQHLTDIDCMLALVCVPTVGLLVGRALELFDRRKIRTECKVGTESESGHNMPKQSPDYTRM